MTLLREVVESFLRLLRAEVHSAVVLVPPDDVFEVPKAPSFIVQGPTPVEDGARRCPARLLVKDEDGFTESDYPRLYHLDFDLIATAGDGAAVLDMQEKVARFFHEHPTLPVGERGSLNITLLAPMGGWRRVNLSNLRQVSGRCRIEDCPVYGDVISTGKLIHTRIFEFRGGVNEDAVFQEEKRMVEVKNLLFQPITLHYGGTGRGFHLGPRERIQLRDEEVSPEIEMAARRGHVTLTTMPGEPVAEGPLSPVTDPDIEKAVKQTLLGNRPAAGARNATRRRN